MILVNLATLLLCATFSYGQQNYTLLNISGTINPFDVSFNATLNLTCGPDALMSGINVKTCPPRNCSQSIVICPFRNKTGIENNCLHQQNCFHNIFWSCPSGTPSEVILEIMYTCSRVGNDFTATVSNNQDLRPFPRPGINIDSPATSTSTGRPTISAPVNPTTITSQTGNNLMTSPTSTTGYSTRTTTPYPLESGNEDKSDSIIIILGVVLILSVIAFLSVTVYMCCIRRRCHKHREVKELPGIALSRPLSALNQYATSPYGVSTSLAKGIDIKVDNETDIYNEIELEDDGLDGSSKEIIANPKTDIDSGYNELNSDKDLPVTVIHVNQNQEIVLAPKEVTMVTRKDSYDHISLDNVFAFVNDPDGTKNSTVGEMQASGNPGNDDDRIVDCFPGSKMLFEDSKTSELCHEQDDFTTDSADETESSHSSNLKFGDEVLSNRTDVTDQSQYGYFTLECIDEVSNHRDDMPDSDVPVVSKCSLDEDKPRCDVVLLGQSIPGANGTHLKTKDLKPMEDDVYATDYNTLNFSGKQAELKVFEGDIGTTAPEYYTLILPEPNSDVKKQMSTLKDTDTESNTIMIETNYGDTNERTSDTGDAVHGQYDKLKLCERVSGINEVIIGNQPIRSLPEKTLSSTDRINDDSENINVNRCETVSGIEDVSFRHPKRSLPKDQVSFTDGRGDSENNKLNHYETVSGTGEVVNLSQPNRSIQKEKFSTSDEREEASKYNTLKLCETELGIEEVDGFFHLPKTVSFTDDREAHSEYNKLNHLETPSGIGDISCRHPKRRPPKKKVSFTDETEDSENN